MARSYAEAITALNTLQSSFAVRDEIRKSGAPDYEDSFSKMRSFCRSIGYEPSDLARLNVVHIAGTKGKGSTSAFTSSILTQFLGQMSDKTGKKIQKIALCTSPHLRFVRERFRINDTPLGEESFAKYFFEVWDRLEKSAIDNGRNPVEDKPPYARYLSLMAFHVSMSEGVDGLVLECSCGGRFDSTNVIERPVVTAITRLGIDHVEVLGPTIREIAWHKAGIMKENVMCFTPNDQKEEAIETLRHVAGEVGAEVIEVGIHHDIRSGMVEIGLEGSFQQSNASLAIELATVWLQEMKVQITDAQKVDGICQGLKRVKWPGRCETRRENGIVWCIDGAHTLESMEVVGAWFANKLRPSLETSGSTPRCLIFNQRKRDGNAQVKAFHSTLSAALGRGDLFTHVIFCTNITRRNSGCRPGDLVSLETDPSILDEMRIQTRLATTWKQIDPKTIVKVVRTIEEAVALVRSLTAAQQPGDDIIALTTGDLRLIGGFLEVIESNDGSHEKDPNQSTD